MVPQKAPGICPQCPPGSAGPVLVSFLTTTLTTSLPTLMTWTPLTTLRTLMSLTTLKTSTTLQARSWQFY